MFDFLNMEVPVFLQRLVGHVLGVCAILFALLSLFFFVVAIMQLFAGNYGDLLLMALVALGTSIMTTCTFLAARLLLVRSE